MDWGELIGLKENRRAEETLLMPEIASTLTSRLEGLRAGSDDDDQFAINVHTERLREFAAKWEQRGIIALQSGQSLEEMVGMYPDELVKKENGRYYPHLELMGITLDRLDQRDVVPSHELTFRILRDVLGVFDSLGIQLAPEEQNFDKGMARLYETIANGERISRGRLHPHSHTTVERTSRIHSLATNIPGVGVDYYANTNAVRLFLNPQVFRPPTPPTN